MQGKRFWCLFLLLLVASPSSASRAGNVQAKRSKTSSQPTQTILEKIKHFGQSEKGTYELITKDAARKGLGKLLTRQKKKNPELQQLSFGEKVVAGGIARALSLSLTYPLSKYKTLLQLNKASDRVVGSRLFQGLDAQLALALPVGAIHLAIMESINTKFQSLAPNPMMVPVVDFLSSAATTTVCSAFSMPETVITDRIMAGVYPSMRSAITSIYKTEGIRGFYRGWLPALAHKIPAHGVTWVFFEQFKRVHKKVTKRTPTATEGFLLASLASAASAAIFIPLETAKTRIVANTPALGQKAYTGMISTLRRITAEEGVGALYRALPPRLLSVVPSVAVQLGVYEVVKQRILKAKQQKLTNKQILRDEDELVASSDDI